MIWTISIGTYETLEAISRQISKKYHKDFFEIKNIKRVYKTIDGVITRVSD